MPALVFTRADFLTHESSLHDFFRAGFFRFFNPHQKENYVPSSSLDFKRRSRPQIKVRHPRTIHQIGSEDAEELVQDSFCMAAKLLNNAEKARKQVSAGNIA